MTRSEVTPELPLAMNDGNPFLVAFGDSARRLELKSSRKGPMTKPEPFG